MSRMAGASKAHHIVDPMKIPSILPIAALMILAVPACDRPSPEVARKIAELEQKNNEAAGRQRELEQQIEDQKLAVERDAIERERALIEQDRIELERQTGQAAADQEEALRKREEDIARREGKLQQLQASLEEKEENLGARGQELSERDREIAGREALPFEQEEQTLPVADYGTFYDSLSSYGSWFETPDYGYVWQPAVVREANWRPYSRGRWVCSDRGWTWVSEEPFGWATYHYGRWALTSGRGWIWVPGTEWAPCWVSWRENDSHIGWAPLPPETLAWRGQSWDTTVDVRFGIGAAWFNFVEIGNFGSPIYRYCLPVSGNRGWYGTTTNITYIHIQNRQVICGGPRYQRINQRIGKPIPFYRLEVDRHPRMGSGQLAMRPEINDGRLRMSAPNMDAAWNAGLRPKQVRGRIEKVNVERSVTLDKEITERFRQSRVEGREKADKSIAELGGRDRFEENRNQKLKVNREQLETARPKAVVRGPEREVLNKRIGQPQKQDGPKVTPPQKGNALPEGATRGTDRKPGTNVGRPGNGNRADVSKEKADHPRVAKGPDLKETRTADGQPRITPKEPAMPLEIPGKRKQPETRVESNRQAVEAIEKENANRKLREQAQQVQQRQAEQSREAQKEAGRRNLEDQTRQKQQQEQQRQIDQERQKQQSDNQAREARNQAMEQSRKQQAAQDEARRQQQEQHQREGQRQQELAQQRQQEIDRQRQQEQDQQQRQQEQSRQRQQEQDQQQRKQEERGRQQQKQDDNEGKRQR